jgi:hypothetical protein
MSSAVPKRHSITVDQLHQLKVAFNQTPFPDLLTCGEMAKHIGLSQGIVEIWFQNTQALYRRQMRETHQVNFFT